MTATNNKSQQLNSTSKNSKLSFTKPPSKRATKQQQKQATHEDSVVISKSALDDLLKQLVDAKQAANTLPAIIGDAQDHSNTDHTHQTNNDKVTGRMSSLQHQEPIGQSMNHMELQKKHHQHNDSIKYKDLDYSDIPGLSSFTPAKHQTTADASPGGDSTGKPTLLNVLHLSTTPYLSNCSNIFYSVNLSSHALLILSIKIMLKILL